MSAPSLFEKNLKLFSRFSEKYLSDIRNADCSDYEFCQTELDETNLKKNNIGCYHSQKGAIQEAKQQFQEIENLRKIESIFIYGLGLGYFYDAAKKWLEENNNHFLIFLEDDFALIHRFLELPRATEILSHPQVVVQAFRMPEEEKSQKIPQEFEMISWTFSRFPMKIKTLKMYEKERTKATELIRLMLHVNFSDIEVYMGEVSDQAIKEIFACIYFNLHLITDAFRGQNLQDVFRHIPAIICGAGPSLGKIFQELKKLENRALIFGAGTGMNVLNKLGMIPYFGGALDPFIESLQRIKTNYAFEVPYFYMNSFQYYALRQIHGPLIFFRTESESTIEDWFDKELDIKDTKTIKTKVSTTSYLLNVAQFLGCSPIALAGIDLAYTDSARYPKEIKSHPLDPPIVEKLLREVNIGSGKIFPLKNAEGEVILTRYDWIAEGESYSAFSKEFPDSKLFNVTKGGLKIVDVPNPTLQEIAEKYLSKEYDFINMVHAAIQCAGKMPITKEKLAQTYEKWRKSLKTCSTLFSEVVALYQSLRVEVLKTGILPPTCFTDEISQVLKKIDQQPAYEYSLKQMVDTHKKITYRNMHAYTYFPELFSDRERFLKDLEFEESKMQFLHHFANMHLDIIEKAIHVEIERVTPDSKPIEKAPGDLYSIEKGRFVVHDEEMQINIDEPFQAEKIPNQSIKGEFYTLNKMFHGPSRFFTNDGILLAEGWFYKGKRIGKNWLYYASGSLYSIQRFKQGERHGIQEYYDESGQKKSIIRYADGLLDGKTELFHPNGLLAREIHFSQGKLHGIEREWLANGQQISECQYDMNAPIGTSRRWHANGVLFMEKIFYDSADHFDLRQWNDKGEKTAEELYFKDIGKQFLQDSKERRESLDILKKQLEEMKQRKKEE